MFMAVLLEIRRESEEAGTGGRWGGGKKKGEGRMGREFKYLRV